MIEDATNRGCWKRNASRGLLALAVVTSAAPAAAQSAVDSERAEKLFTEASGLATQGDFKGACPKFAESERLDPALGTRFNLALCYEKIGRLGGAWRGFRAAANLAHATGKTGREDAARQKLAELRGRVSHLALSVRDMDATVKVDGERVERDDWSFYAVDAGEHTVEATAPAKKPWQARVTVPATASGSPGVELGVSVPALAPVSGEVRIVTTSTPKRTVGFALGALGIVGAAAAAATGVVVLNAKSTAEEKCRPRCVDQEGRDAVSTVTTMLPVNAIAWAVAAVGLVGGTLLVLTSSTKTAGALHARLSLGPTGTGVWGEF